MKTIQMLFVALFFLVFLTACEKEEELPKIEPSDLYFPAYPGSYWKYSGRDACTWNIADEYSEFLDVRLPYFENAGYHVLRYGLAHYVAVGHGNLGSNISPIANISNIDSAICSISFVNFDLSFGSGSFQTTIEQIAYRRILLTSDTSITLSNNESYDEVKVVKEIDRFNSDHIYYDFFAQGIGLIRRDQALNGNVNNIITIMELEDYRIGL